MQTKPILACPRCHSQNLISNGRDASSLYTQGVLYAAWKCRCGHAFIVTWATSPKPTLLPAQAATT